MRILKPLILGLCVGSSAAAVASPVSILAAERAEASWVVVPDAELARLHGGFDFGQGNLVAYFAIARTVEVNGQVVAQMQLVISNLGNLASGGQPQISVTGPLAQLIQVLNSGQGASASGAAGVPVDAALPLLASPAGATPVASSVVAASSSPGVTSGSVSSPDVQSGSTAQFGGALSSAVAAANGALTGGGGGTAPATAAPAAGAVGARTAPLPAQVSPTVQAGPVASASPPASVAPATTAPAPGPAGARTAPLPAQVSPTAQAGPVASASLPAPVAPAPAAVATASPPVTSAPGPGGVVPVIVISNLPNATAITTAVQNDVQATTVQTQTTITATLGSLPVVNAMSLAAAIQSQVAASIGH